jgi:DNA-directed RNA polymerase subunit RPC12/RpoP
LIAFLQQEIELEDDGGHEGLLSKRIKIESAIHMLGTLKSINEGSLSDWQAVIGEEIVEQKEKQEEKEETLREIIEMMRTLPDKVSEDDKNAPDDTVDNDLQKEMASIRNEVRVLASQISGVPIRTTIPKKRRVQVEQKCPKCGILVTYTQKMKGNSTKALNCPHCGVALVSQLKGDSFSLSERTAVAEHVECPNCKSVIAFALDPMVGSSAEIECKKCRATLRATRRATLIRVRFLDSRSGVLSPNQISEDLLLRIKEAMGGQPWATGRSRQVAIQLDLPKTVVDRGVQLLISRGDFYVQHNGKLYTQVNGGSTEQTAAED